MNLNDILIFAGISVFVWPLTYMMGYARREKQQEGWAADSRKGFDMERVALEQHYKTEQTNDRNVIRELEISLLKAGEALEIEANKAKEFEVQWKISNPYRLVIVQNLLDWNLWSFEDHGSSPTNMLNKLYERVVKDALNPETNKLAKNLFVKGVRKGAKQGREQMRKLMQKSIDNQAATIGATSKALHVAIRSGEIHRDAVRNVLNDKIALPNVRRALGKAIIEETGRLRAVAAKQGE